MCYIICNIIVLSGGFSQKLLKCKTMRNVIAAIEGVSRVSALHYCHSHCILLSRAAPIFCLKNMKCRGNFEMAAKLILCFRCVHAKKESRRKCFMVEVPLCVIKLCR